MTNPDAVAAEVTAWARKQLLDQAAAWCDRFVHAMRDEGITDEVTARVVNRVLTSQPDPDEVIRPPDASASVRHQRVDGLLLAACEQHGGPACH